MKSIRMSLNDVWRKYDTGHKAINKRMIYCGILGVVFGLCSYITSHFNTDDNMLMSILHILSLIIAVFQLLLLIICFREGKKLDAWLEKNYICPICGSYFGDSSPDTLGDRCKKCGSSIGFYSSKSVKNLNLNGWIFASSLFCTILALLLLCIGYLYPYSIPNLDLNPNSVYRKLANDMVFVQGGPAHIGATEDQKPETDSFPDEQPDTTIKVSDFYICKHEVTQDLWKTVMGDNPSDHDGDSFPVENVSYLNCLKFIKN